MAEMKFKFTIQPYQTEAVDSVVGVLPVSLSTTTSPTAEMLKSSGM